MSKNSSSNALLLFDSHGLAPSSWVELGELAKGLGLEVEDNREAVSGLVDDGF